MYDVVPGPGMGAKCEIQVSEELNATVVWCYTFMGCHGNSYCRLRFFKVSSVLAFIALKISHNYLI
jgi:hypothetical protein